MVLEHEYGRRRILIFDTLNGRKWANLSAISEVVWMQSTSWSTWIIIRFICWEIPLVAQFLLWLRHWTTAWRESLLWLLFRLGEHRIVSLNRFEITPIFTDLFLGLDILLTNQHRFRSTSVRSLQLMHRNRCCLLLQNWIGILIFLHRKK